MHGRAIAAIALALTCCDGGSDKPPAATAQPPAPTATKAAAEPVPTAAPSSAAWATVSLEPADDSGFFVRPVTAFGDAVKLPTSRAYEGMSAGAPVVIGRENVYVEGRPVAGLTDGSIAAADVQRHVITKMLPALKSAAQRLDAAAATKGEPSFGSLILFVDGSFRMAGLVDVMATANRAGFREYQLAVAVGVDDLPVGVVLPLSPPKFGPDGAAVVSGPALSAEIDDTKVAVWTGPDDIEELVFDHTNADHYAPLVAVAKARAAAAKPAPDAFPTLWFSAAPDVTVDRLVAVLSTLAGPECSAGAVIDVDHERCFFPLRIIEAESRRPR